MAAGDIVYEIARLSEAAALAEMSRRLVEDGLEWRWTPIAIDRCIRHPETEVLVARDPQTLARLGFGMMRLMDLQAHLLLLAVVPRARRRGVGRGLMRWLEAEVRTAGLRRIELEVRASNSGARRFYLELGYTEETLISGYYQGRESAIRMALRL